MFVSKFPVKCKLCVVSEEILNDMQYTLEKWSCIHACYIQLFSYDDYFMAFVYPFNTILALSSDLQVSMCLFNSIIVKYRKKTWTIIQQQSLIQRLLSLNGHVHLKRTVVTEHTSKQNKQKKSLRDRAGIRRVLSWENDWRPEGLSCFICENSGQDQSMEF